MSGFDTGIDGIKTLIPLSSSVVFQGPPMSGKSIFAKNFFYKGLENQESSILITSNESAKKTIDWFSKNKMSLEKHSDRYGIIDCISLSQELDKASSDKNVSYASNPADLTDIGIKTSEYIRDLYKKGKEEKIRICIDSVSIMMMYSDTKNIFRFLHTFSGRIKSIDGTLLILLEEGSHEEKTLNIIKQIMDIQIKSKIQDEQKQLRINGNGIETNWKNYEIKQTKLKIQK
ncbi:KaiC-like protein ATPase [Methanonatronarchaeum thermophilum]|uniref:KaiC-like protein ATPase n=1 Tax=Methanonatronarchaeum thermophilum TaxID=1927129 RepID=A0A1Y3GBQ0_9EURY|nr:ATPase domain-containing protein [Methanonatronarchaeum thermophilum]OUJ18670.1 KaiC-like protein ATPase [Methanonatronarchaeum thermophilum]